MNFVGMSCGTDGLAFMANGRLREVSLARQTRSAPASRAVRAKASRWAAAMAMTMPGAQAMTARQASAAGIDSTKAVPVEKSALMPAAALRKPAASQGEPPAQHPRPVRVVRREAVADGGVGHPQVDDRHEPRADAPGGRAAGGDPEGAAG